MNSLFIDTHCKDLIIGIKSGDLYKEIKMESINNHSQYAVDFIQKLLVELNIDIKDIDEIIVINGPGSFTGVRIGVTIAKTIAYSLSIPIKTLTALDAYFITNEESSNVTALADSKGVYILEKENGKNNYKYLKLASFEKLYKNRKVFFGDKIDVPKIILYSKKLKAENPHQVKPFYIKEINL